MSSHVLHMLVALENDVLVPQTSPIAMPSAHQTLSEQPPAPAAAAASAPALAAAAAGASNGTERSFDEPGGLPTLDAAEAGSCEHQPREEQGGGCALASAQQPEREHSERAPSNSSPGQPEAASARVEHGATHMSVVHMQHALSSVVPEHATGSEVTCARDLSTGRVLLGRVVSRATVFIMLLEEFLPCLSPIIDQLSKPATHHHLSNTFTAQSYPKHYQNICDPFPRTGGSSQPCISANS
jgi:hypothetical protein